jgi:hypothetical protein
MDAMGTRPDDDRVPFAAGVHLPWSEVPEEVRHWVGGVVGSPIVDATDMAGGFSPGCCTLLHFEDGQSVFVKAVGEALNPISPGMHRREGKIAPALPRSARLPVFIEGYDDGDWVALLYREIRGVLPRQPWVETELDAVLEGLAAMHESLTPCPIVDIEKTSARDPTIFTGWRSLASMTAPPDELDEWSRRHLDALAELEARCPAALDQGDTLVHGDIRSDNVLLAEPGAVFIDRPHASRGSTLSDLVGWAPSVALEGGPDPETLIGRYRTSTRWDDDATNAIIAGVAGYFTSHALRPAQPGLPTIRDFQGAQGVVARSWLRRRTGWG